MPVLLAAKLAGVPSNPRRFPSPKFSGSWGPKHVSVDVRAVASDRIVDVDIHRVVVSGLELGGGLRLGARRRELEVGGVSSRRLDRQATKLERRLVVGALAGNSVVAPAGKGVDTGAEGLDAVVFRVDVDLVLRCCGGDGIPERRQASAPMIQPVGLVGR